MSRKATEIRRRAHGSCENSDIRTRVFSFFFSFFFTQGERDGTLTEKTRGTGHKNNTLSHVLFSSIRILKSLGFFPTHSTTRLSIKYIRPIQPYPTQSTFPLRRDDRQRTPHDTRYAKKTASNGHKRLLIVRKAV